jgi:hypothetical protein
MHDREGMNDVLHDAPENRHTRRYWCPIGAPTGRRGQFTLSGLAIFAARANADPRPPGAPSPAGNYHCAVGRWNPRTRKLAFAPRRSANGYSARSAGRPGVHLAILFGTPAGALNALLRPRRGRSLLITHTNRRLREVLRAAPEKSSFANP